MLGDFTCFPEYCGDAPDQGLWTIPWSAGTIKYWVYQAISVTYWQAITDYLVLRMVVIYTKVVGAWAHNICVSCNVFY